jgi:hypothetical protein
MITTAFVGRWIMLSRFAQKSDPWNFCPQTRNYLNSTWSKVLHRLDDHPKKYSCPDKMYRKAQFQTPDDCLLLEATDSLKYLSSHHQSNTSIDKHYRKKRIVYVGDSLVAQLYIAARCFVEGYNLRGIKFSYVKDAFLRDDIPCDPRCLNNQTFVEIHRTLLTTPCFGCPNGTKKEFSKFIQHHDAWNNRIPRDTFAIIIGVGSWYNNFKGINDSIVVFQESLNMVIPILHQVQKKYNVQIYWHGLPPMFQESASYDFYAQFYNWNGFLMIDSIAQNVMEANGFKFINVAKLLGERKKKDFDCGADALHWCNPGLQSGPNFINRIIFHSLAINEGYSMNYTISV